MKVWSFSSCPTSLVHFMFGSFIFFRQNYVVMSDTFPLLDYDTSVSNCPNAFFYVISEPTPYHEGPCIHCWAPRMWFIYQRPKYAQHPVWNQAVWCKDILFAPFWWVSLRTKAFFLRNYCCSRRSVCCNSGDRYVSPPSLLC